jgi:hypothetical protein
VGQSPQPGWRSGGCHCGAVRFRVRVTQWRALSCNCSICTKKGLLHLIVEAPDFELVQGDASLAEYSFGTHIARHWFCRGCGIHPFYRPRSHPEGVDVNVRCLDGVDLERWSIESFDGRHWEAHIDEIRD